MSKFTTQLGDYLKYVYSLSHTEPTNNINNIVIDSGVRSDVFGFNYPFYTQEQKAQTEANILRHYFNREIGFETIGLFKNKLIDRMCLIMPKYVPLFKQIEDETFNPLNTVSYKETRTMKEHGDNSGTQNISNNGKVDSYNRFSDTPQGSLSDVEAGKYLTNATVNTDSTTQTGKTDITNSNDVNRDETIIHIGKNAGDDYATSIYNYNSKFKSVDQMIIDELSDLFMGIWEPAGGFTGVYW